MSGKHASVLLAQWKIHTQFSQSFLVQFDCSIGMSMRLILRAFWMLNYTFLNSKHVIHFWLTWTDVDDWPQPLPNIKPFQLLFSRCTVRSHGAAVCFVGGAIKQTKAPMGPSAFQTLAKDSDTVLKNQEQPQCVCADDSQQPCRLVFSLIAAWATLHINHNNSTHCGST